MKTHEASEKTCLVGKKRFSLKMFNVSRNMCGYLCKPDSLKVVKVPCLKRKCGVLLAFVVLTRATDGVTSFRSFVSSEDK